MARRRTDCCPVPTIHPDGRVSYDWRGHDVGKRSGKCRICGRWAIMRDCTGTPCHKVCAEAEATRELATREPAR